MGAIGYESSGSSRMFNMPHRIVGHNPDIIDWKPQLRRLGFTYDSDTCHDSYGWLTTLPEGWRVVYTADGGEYIVDSKGRYRISISGSYKVYDWLSGKTATLLNWLRIEHDELFSRGNVGERYVVTGGGDTILFISTVYVSSSRGDTTAYHNAREEIRQATIRWCDEHYPDWRDPLKYWD